MAKFKIPIEWRCYGEVEVEAKNLDEAFDEVNLNSDEVILPKDWSLVEGSVTVMNVRETEELNPGHKLSKKLRGVIVGAQTTEQEEREARRHLEGLGEGYGEETEEEIDEDEN